MACGVCPVSSSPGAFISSVNIFTVRDRESHVRGGMSIVCVEAVAAAQSIVRHGIAQHDTVSVSHMIYSVHNTILSHFNVSQIAKEKSRFVGANTHTHTEL